MQSIFISSRGKRYFTRIDLASGFFHLNVAEKEWHKTAFRDCNKGPYELIRAGFRLTVLPAAFISVVKCALGPPKPDVVSWLDNT